MFAYYGGKGKIAKYYPIPRHKLIIEPFAGSAKYALLHHAANEVWINEKDKDIYDVWKYIQTCDYRDIETLPRLHIKDNIQELNLSQVTKNLLKLIFSGGNQTPLRCNLVQNRVTNKTALSKFQRDFLYFRPYVEKWKITNFCYSQLENIEATWFIDPPYTDGGKGYKENKIDYTHLAEWCKSRKGQIIVCEKALATWLPFRFYIHNSGSTYNQSEGIWTNDFIRIYNHP